MGDRAEGDVVVRAAIGAIGADDWRTAMTHALTIWASGYDPGAPAGRRADVHPVGEAPVADGGPEVGPDPSGGVGERS